MWRLKSLSLIGLAFGIAGPPTFAQDAATITSFTNDLRMTRFVAPGQIIRLSFRDIQGTWDFGGRIASKIPIPTTIFGLSLTLRQTGSADEIPLSLIATSGMGGNCSGLLIPVVPPGNVVPCTSGAGELGMVVQIPYRLKTNRPSLGIRGDDAINAPCGPFRNPPSDCLFDISDAVLTLREAGRATHFRVTPVEDQVQIIKSCAGTQLGNYTTPVCPPAIFHADGRAVSAANPAKAGEVVTVYAYGLGAPDTLFDDAMGTPASGVPVSRPISVTFSGGVTPGSVLPEYVGLTPQSAGLYQLNLRLPELQADFPACETDRDFNITMSVKGTASADSASFCISR